MSGKDLGSKGEPAVYFKVIFWIPDSWIEFRELLLRVTSLAMGSLPTYTMIFSK
jgi:hypothetical protein